MKTDPILSAMEASDSSATEPEKEDEPLSKIDKYVKSKKTLLPNPKIENYKEIIKYYDQSMKNIKFQVGEEEEELQNAAEENEEETARTKRNNLFLVIKVS